MAKFNVIQKERRANVGDRKRAAHGDPNTGKLKKRPQPLSISGKRKRKLFKKWRRDQKEAVQKGLVTMEDVEMVLSEGASQDIDTRSPKKFHLKKSSKLQIKKLKGKGKNKRKSSKPNKGASVDAMVE